MDFDLSEEQRAVAAAAQAVLAGTAPDRTWKALADAGLLALPVPSRLGGEELGAGEVAVLLSELGRHGAQTPALATVMLGALSVVRWGNADLQNAVLSGVSSGEVLVTAGVREQSAAAPGRPRTVARLTAGAGTVSGTKIGVPYAAQARWILVPASVAGPAEGETPAAALIVVDLTGPGVTLVATPSSSGAPECTVSLEDSPVTGLLGGPDAVADLLQLAAAGAAALGAGALSGALDLTAAYVAKREQFGRPLATFQAVAQQVADVYIASRTLHLAALSACWRLASGLPASHDAAVAAYWLAREAPAAMRTCHHLHGGIGLDITYPLHRYSAMISDLVRFVGGPDERLDLLAPERAAG